MTRYRHPVLREGGELAGITMVGEDAEVLLGQGRVPTGPVVMGWDEGMALIEASDQERVRLGIPDMAYCAFVFVGEYVARHVRRLIQAGRAREYECRIWLNPLTEALIVCFAVPEEGEDTGYDLYEYGKKHAGSFEEVEMASWWEFCNLGVPIPDDWQLVMQEGWLLAVSPDGSKSVSICQEL